MLKKYITEIQEVAQFLVNKGWVERNAGNFSMRIEDHSELGAGSWELGVQLPTPHSQLPTHINLTCLITHTGSKFRDIIKSPRENLGIIMCDNGNITYHTAIKEAAPSSEYISHLLIHDFLEKNKPEKKVILHVHPTHLIALSHKYETSTKDEMNLLLQNALPEVSMFIPEKIGLVPLHPPGSLELAEATLKELVKHNIVLWQKHGCIVVAENVWEAYDNIDILDKAAYIQLIRK